MNLIARALLPAVAPARVRARRFALRVGRDLRAIGDGLRGIHPSPVVTRPPRRPAPPVVDRVSATDAAARDLEVVEIRRETDDAISIVLADPGGAALSCAAGQFFTLLVDIDGDRLRRAYSASWIDPDRRRVAVTVKRVAGGRVSNHLNDTLRPGHRISVLGPSGDFVVAPATGPRHLVLIGAGSGITPLLAIIRDLLGSEPTTRITLLYGNRSAAAALFVAELDGLAGDRLEVRHVLEDESGTRTAHRGRLDEATIADQLATIVDGSDGEPVEYFVCGPAPVMDAARAVLRGRGVPLTAIREERFASPAPRPAAGGSAHVVTLRRPGAAARAVMVGPGATILDAGLGAGVAMPYSCAMGGCGACAVTLVEGAVDMDEPTCLTADERSRGVVLACVARPRGACTLELRR
jgi:ferredoxin-NADP reductase